ncbi:glycoside hydrolase [Candidatus Falkowbacteria bacterium]|nr:MAG: glycoside hydrolase [Candidatus Falkowbacteria bacterium]
MKDKIIKECYRRSVELLKKNSNKYGVMAAARTKRAIDKRYDYIFGRDACICSLGMVASQDKKLITSAKKSLISLAKYQTKLGEIPYSIAPNKGKSLFYYLGSIDSTLWWLIAMDFYYKYSGDKKLRAELEHNINKALKWLFYQDQNNCGLLEQGEASDWADDMPSNGMVLYTNALWYKVLDLYRYEKEKELARDGLNNIFLPHQANPRRSKYIGKEIHRLKELRILQEAVEDVPYYLHYISYRYASDRCDVYANCLAILFNIASPARTRAIIRFLRNAKVSRKYPTQALTPPIQSGDIDWREYMEREDCANKPFGYHNGGIWPYIGAFYVMAFKKAGKEVLAQKEMKNLAEANKVHNWQFNEWFHGKTGQPMGMAGQSWNAGMFLFAFHYLNGDIDF